MYLGRRLLGLWRLMNLTEKIPVDLDSAITEPEQDVEVLGVYLGSQG
jgi:hypothetical protein